MRTTPRGFLLCAMILGFVFLYLPIITLIVYSFNEAAVGSTWKGFTLKWYYSLFRNEQILHGAWISIQVAFISATLAIILGTLAATALSRTEKFRGKGLFSFISIAPLVMPEIITGLSILLFFVAFEQAFSLETSRGIPTIVIAHTTLCMAYVTIIVRSRLVEMDRAVEEAALDLGARPFKVFLTITLPIISPALLSGWLLAFALSMDDLVIASFTTGPGASTLPMIIFASIRFKMNPEINALATIIITFVAFSVALAGYLVSRRK